MNVYSVVLVAAVSLGVAAPVAAQAVPDSLPDGVTAPMIAEGKMIYRGAGICSVCHGGDAKGIENLGANLTDDKWVHGDGSYDAIVNTIVKGAWAKSGTAMPHQNATTMNDLQVRAVAAYVWSLSRTGTPAGN